jgi:anti-sigma factor RsiW
MPGLQFDPNQGRTLLSQRHAELIDEGCHQQLVKAAVQHAASSAELQPRVPRGGLSWGLPPLLTTLGRNMSFAAVE